MGKSGVRCIEFTAEPARLALMMRSIPLLALSFAPLSLVPAADVPLRAVWLQQLSGDADPYGAGNHFALMARELPGEARALQAGPGNFSRPLLSADGNTVYFTDRRGTASDAGTVYAPEIFAVPFAGGAPRSLGTGMAVAVWKSPEGPEYLYALTSLQSSRRPGLTGEILVRFEPAKPEEREIVWTESAVGVDNFQLSRDGKRAAGQFPAPHAGVADMEGRTFRVLGQGSFPSLAPDDSYALALLDGDRRRLRMFVPGVEPGWDLQPAQQLPQQSGQINHPRWSNHPLYLAFSGPPAQGEVPEVHVARLRPDLKAIEQVITLSSAPEADSYPDVWVGGAPAATELAQSPVVAAPPVVAAWPVTDDGLHFAWENAAAAGAEKVFTLRGHATPGRMGALNVSAGWAEVPAEATARLSVACAESGAFTMEALITERRTQPPCSVRILALRTADGRDAFALYRVNGVLVARVLTGSAEQTPLTERFTLTPLAIEDDRPFSLVLTVHAGRLGCYLDGQFMKEFALDQPGLAAWKDLLLVAGDAEPYGTPWTGQLERIALYSRALAAAEVTDIWTATEALLSNRPRPTRIKLKARLAESTPLFTPAGEDAAQPWLQASAWDVEQVHLGFLKPKRITILQWSWLDGKAVPPPPVAVGQSIDLSVESLDDHPELRSLKTHNALGSGENPIYLDTTAPGRHPAPFPR